MHEPYCKETSPVVIKLIIASVFHLQVQQAHVLDQSTAHVVAPAAEPLLAQPVNRMKHKAKKQAAHKASAGARLVALDSAACLAEMLVMGSGLVEESLVKQLL